MNLRRIITVLLISVLFMQSCKDMKSTNDGFIERDLISKGIPLKIMAPEDAEVNIKVENFYKDITIKKGSDYSVQIICTEALVNEIVAVREELENEVRKNPYFAEIISEDPNGFVYSKKSENGSLIYDFRYIKIEGGQQFVFQAGKYGEFTKEQAMKMFDSVKS
jgi:hypothetical protein